MSVPPRSSALTPLRPIRPYISLDDPHTNKFFTRSHIQDHLRRAGLLNKQGEILTQAEYDSKQTDVAIGRENRRKIDDAITDMLRDMAREHWAYAREYTNTVRKDLLYQFRRIENQYRRRTQPITIRHSSNRRIQLRGNSIEPRRNTHFEMSESSNGSPTGMLPPIQSVHFQSHPRSSHAPTEQPSTEIDNIRQELNAMNDKLTELDRKLNYKLTKDEHRRQTNSKKSSAIDKQQTDHLKQISILIEELQNRILILETSSHPLPTELSQQATDQTTKINEKQTTDTQHIIEKLVGDLDDKIKQIEIQLTQILARSERIPDPNTYVDIIQPIQNDANNTPQSQLDNNEWRNLEPEAINKVNHLETQYNQFFQSTEDNTPRFALEESVISTGLLHQKLVSKASNASRNGFDNLDHPSNTIPSSSNLALENGSDGRKLQRQEIPQIRNNIENNFEQDLRDLYNTVRNYFETRPNYQEIYQLIQKNEERTNQNLKEFNELIEDNQNALKNMENYINDLYRRLNQQPKTSSKQIDKSNSDDDSITAKPTPKELQTIMPFVELLPTFDMFNENEWIYM